MNRKTTWLLASTLILVGGALFGAKWKQDHPTLTPRDAAVRQSLVSANEVYIYQFGTFYHALSDQERQTIAPHIFVVGSTNSGSWNTNRVRKLQWQSADHVLHSIIMDADSQRTYYEN